MAWSASEKHIIPVFMELTLRGIMRHVGVRIYTYTELQKKWEVLQQTHKQGTVEAWKVCDETLPGKKQSRLIAEFQFHLHLQGPLEESL